MGTNTILRNIADRPSSDLRSRAILTEAYGSDYECAKQFVSQIIL